MPFKSEKQRKFLHAQYPSLARKFEAEEKRVGGRAAYKQKVKAKKKP